MGLAVSVGIFGFDSDPHPEAVKLRRIDFAEVNRVLAAHGLPPHEEPEWLTELPEMFGPGGFPYSWLHYLRRAVAYARQAPRAFRPVAEGEDPTEDARLDIEQSVTMDSHLICHSDCEGFYVPIDFPVPLFDDCEGGLLGGILGSSQRALEEVMQAAPLIGIPLADGCLPDDVAPGIAEETQGSHPYWLERQVWLTMYEAFRVSVEHGCAVIFE